jgi:predicted nuclease of predicted toxin-antitoxin system
VRFLVDQSADGRLLPYLREQGHDVTRVARDYPAGVPDPEVLAIAHRERRILIAHDRDVGELVVDQLRPHAGVILFRLGPAPSLALMTARLYEAFSRHAPDLDRFIVVTPHLIRVRG